MKKRKKVNLNAVLFTTISSVCIFHTHTHTKENSHDKVKTTFGSVMHKKIYLTFQ